MIVLNRKRLILSLSLIILVTMILIGYGLYTHGGRSWSFRFELQSFFFWGLIALLSQIWIGISLILNHQKLMKNIKILSSFDDFDSLQAEKAFEKLGLLGEELRKVLRKENQVSVMRADRIAVLNNLVNVLCENYSEQILVTDINGAIFAKSDALKKRIINENGSGIFNNILEIKPDIQLSEVLGLIEKQRTSWKDPDGSGLVCTPVFDKKGSVHFCIWEFETNFFTGKIKELTQQKTKAAPVYKKSRDLINRFRRKK